MSNICFTLREETFPEAATAYHENARPKKRRKKYVFFSATFISELCSVVIFQSDLNAYMQAMPQAILQEPVDMSVSLSECHNNFITSVIF